MRTFQSYQQEDFENHGSPFDAPWDDAPAAPAVERPANPATEKQINFLIKLMDERNRPWTQATLDKLSKRDASELISALLDEPKAKAPRTGATSPEITEDGMYQMPTGEIFKVQIAIHGSGKLYAKALIVDESGAYFEYAAGAIRKLRPEWKMTMEQAKAFGSLYGVCCNCAKPLTKEDSIFNGYGATCAGNNGWPYEKAPKIK